MRTRRHPELAKIDAERVARGACRHCGGPVPCWSEFGDALVGVGWRDLTAAERRVMERRRG